MMPLTTSRLYRRLLLAGFLCLTSISAWAQSTADTAEKVLQERIASRWQKVSELANSGVLTLLDDGTFEVARDSTPEIEKLVRSDNMDRLAVFALVSAKRGVAADDVAKEFVTLYKARLAALPKPAAPLFNPKPLLRAHGSNTLGGALVPAIAEAFLKARGYQKVHRLDSTTDSKLAKNEAHIAGQLPSSQQFDWIEVRAHGSKTAFVETVETKATGLLGGFCDIGLSSSKVDAEAVQAMVSKGLGNPESARCEQVIGLDGLAILVHPANPLSTMSKATVRAIFLREITDWSQVPQEEVEAGQRLVGKILVCARDHQSGTTKSFEDMVLGKDAAGKALKLGDVPLNRDRDNFKDSESSIQVSDWVAQNPLAIGFVSLSFIRDSKPLAISASGGKAYLPTRSNVKLERYPLSRRLYYYLPDARTPVAEDFLAFTLKSEGQEEVDKADFISVAGNRESDQKEADREKSELLTNTAIPKAYRDLISRADRRDTLFDFRFASNKTTLDTRSQADLLRLARLLEAPGNSNAKVILIGFSDPRGVASQNLALSIRRAEQIKQALEERVACRFAAVTGFGMEPSLMLGGNGDEDSQARNRRVEVWLVR